MKSIIICEGSTDFALLQYFMRKSYGWQDASGRQTSSQQFSMMRSLKKGSNLLNIGGCGGCSKIIPCFDYVLEINNISAGSEAYDNIVIVTDRDEVGTEHEFAEKIDRIFENRGIIVSTEIINNQWINCTYLNGHGKTIHFRVLLLVLPFEETGAMETFLLDSIAQENEYDALIIHKCNDFVERIDPEKRYLTKRRYITKAKFDAYFSVRTAAEQFVERQNILKNVKWEKYTHIQRSFEKLSEL